MNPTDPPQYGGLSGKFDLSSLQLIDLLGLQSLTLNSGINFDIQNTKGIANLPLPLTINNHATSNLQNFNFSKLTGLTNGPTGNITIGTDCTLTTDSTGGQITNAGTMDVVGAINVGNSGTLTNSKQLTIEPEGDVTMNQSSTLTNNGTINVEAGGTLTDGSVSP